MFNALEWPSYPILNLMQKSQRFNQIVQSICKRKYLSMTSRTYRHKNLYFELNFRRKVFLSIQPLKKEVRFDVQIYVTH